MFVLQSRFQKSLQRQTYWFSVPRFLGALTRCMAPPITATTPLSLSLSLFLSLDRYLRDYQKDGIQFLYNCFAAGHGALLGDDMGLGKTIQVIGLLVAVLKLEAKMDAKPEFLLKKSEKHRTYEGTALIVVPPAVLDRHLESD